MINLIINEKVGNFKAFIDDLHRDTNAFLKRIADGDPQLKKLKNVIYVEETTGAGSLGTTDVYYYTYAFRDIGTTLRPRMGITVNHGHPFLRAECYTSVNADKGKAVIQKIEENLAKDNILVHMPYEENYFNSDYISLVMAYFYREYGDLDKAITETVEMFKNAELRSYSELAEYFFQLT